jgi:hypothetical protein
MNRADVTDRAEIGRFLGKECWPADKGALLEVALSNHATDDVLAMLERLPDGERFETLSAAWEAIGGSNESRRT